MIITRCNVKSVAAHEKRTFNGQKTKKTLKQSKQQQRKDEQEQQKRLQLYTSDEHLHTDAHTSREISFTICAFGRAKLMKSEKNTPNTRRSVCTVAQNVKQKSQPKRKKMKKKTSNT